MAIARIEGNWRRTMLSSSKPDMPGICRSETRISGTSRWIWANADKPSAAVRTVYPFLARICDSTIRVDDASLTRSRLAAVFGVLHLGPGSWPLCKNRSQYDAVLLACEDEQFCTQTRNPGVEVRSPSIRLNSAGAVLKCLITNLIMGSRGSMSGRAQLRERRQTPDL